MGGGDLKDEIAGVEFLKATGYVDPNKIGITGGSYGGFMTLMAIGKTPEIWRAAVEEYGIIDWSSMLKSSDPSLNEYLKSLLGDPEAQQVVKILKKEGRTVDVHYYANEGHGFVKRENQIDAIRRTIAWFERRQE